MSETTSWKKPSLDKEVAEVRHYLREDVLPDYRQMVEQTGRRFSSTMLTDIWITALRSEGVNAKRGKGPFNGKFRPDLPFVVEFECPKEHRNEDRSGIQRVRLVIEDDGWPTLYQGSCDRCSVESIERWMAKCRRCEADEDCNLVDEQTAETVACRHPAGEEECHDPYEGEGHRGILYSLIDAFQDAALLVWATWWDQCPEAAEQWARDEAATYRPGDIDGYVASERARAKAVLEQDRPMLVIDNAGSRRRHWTDEEGVTWLNEHDVPVEIGQAAAWELARKITGHPPQAAVRRAQALRKSRAGLGDGEGDA